MLKYIIRINVFSKKLGVNSRNWENGNAISKTLRNKHGFGLKMETK